MFNKRILVGMVFALLLVSLATAAVEDQVTLKHTTKAGSLVLTPGVYQVKVRGSLVLFTDAKTEKSFSAVATIQKLDKKLEYTEVAGPTADGVQQVESIALQGADYKIVFGPR
jgi:hypothetical protein